MEELKTLLRQLVADFERNRSLILDVKFISDVRKGDSPTSGVGRYTTNGHNLYVLTGFDHQTLIQRVRNKIRGFESTQLIVRWVIAKRYWRKEIRSVEDDLLCLPSVSANIVAGFLVRNFELNDYQFVITPASFYRAFDELAQFFQKDTIQITTYVSLQGPSGDFNSIQRDETVSIIKADNRITQLFNRHYASTDHTYIDMYDGDYVLKLELTLPKDDFASIDKMERAHIDKWFLVTMLAGIGNIEKGKIIRESTDWPLIIIRAPHLFYYHINQYNTHHPSNYYFTQAGVPLLQRAIEVVTGMDLARIDKNFRSAIDRVRKAKATKTFDDRVVELALAQINMRLLYNYD